MLPEHEPMSPSANPRDRAVASELNRKVRNAVGRISSTERELLLLRMDLDLSYREISEILGIPESTIKSRFYKILGRLRQSLNHLKIMERDY
jgi:RNA polymerase sigma-70 factor (ECF subfamily)